MRTQEMRALTLLAVVGTAVCTVIPKEAKGRVVDKRLSDEIHELENGEHNPDYDHEAFLGEEESKRFDELSPEESKQKLGQLFDTAVDSNHDGRVTQQELIEWIRHVQHSVLRSDVKEDWEEFSADTQRDRKVTWQEYVKVTFEDEEEDDDEDDEEDSDSQMQARDKRRWEAADRDGDGALTREEFGDFLHPEDSEHMRDVVVEETLEDIDKNKDGFVSLEEYVEDLFPNKEGKEEPDWVKAERDQFSGVRDKNRDGRMDKEEVKDWVMPPDYDHADAEAKHLIHEADTDKDGSLSREEVLEHHDVFVGSQATDFGEALTRHDEF